MIEQLFGSKTRVKLLHLFYNNPNRSFYVREITRKIDEQINSVRRELANLLGIGIIKSDSGGNRLYYEVNQKYRHFTALQAMFTHINTRKEPAIAAAGDVGTKFQSLGHIDYAVLTGVFTRDQTAAVDVLIVGDVNRNKLAKLMAELEEEEGEELRYTLLSRDQYDYRHNLNDRFLLSLLDAKKTVVVDRISAETAAPATLGKPPEAASSKKAKKAKG